MTNRDYKWIFVIDGRIVDAKVFEQDVLFENFDRKHFNARTPNLLGYHYGIIDAEIKSVKSWKPLIFSFQMIIVTTIGEKIESTVKVIFDDYSKYFREELIAEEGKRKIVKNNLYRAMHGWWCKEAIRLIDLLDEQERKKYEKEREECTKFLPRKEFVAVQNNY